MSIFRSGKGPKAIRRTSSGVISIALSIGRVAGDPSECRACMGLRVDAAARARTDGEGWATENSSGSRERPF